MTYQQWAENYALIFGLTSVEEVKMILSWESIFSMCGYSIAELEDATNYLASGHAPKFRTEHLQAIHDRIKAQRSKQENLNRPNPNRSTCDLCSNTGSVIVPHPTVWNSSDPNYWQECSLWCICSLGRSKKIKMQDYENEKFSGLESRITSLDEYENHFDRSQWRELINRHEKFLREKFHVETKTKEIDKILGRITAKGIR